MTFKRIENIAQLAEIEPVAIACNNWEGYPAAPATTVKTAILGDSLVIQYRVEEDDPRAVCDADHQNVWEDSCVEFFCAVPGTDRYINFEFTSRGVGLACKRKSRTECKEPFGAEQMSRIGRNVEKGNGWWTLTLTIPVDLVGITGALPEALMCNFYKCGDLCPHPHYLSWAPISTPTPDFHRPEYFSPVPLG